jgi:hypothetical protein
MSRIDHVGAVLGELAAEAGLDGLALDESQRASLEFDGVTVTFAYGAEPAELLWLFIDLGEIPEDGEAAPHCLLRLGLATWAQSVMTLALDEAGTRALGYTVMAVSVLDLATLKEVLARLLEGAKPIRERLARRDFEVEIEPAFDGGAPPGANGAMRV